MLDYLEYKQKKLIIIALKSDLPQNEPNKTFYSKDEIFFYLNGQIYAAFITFLIY